MAFAPLSDTTLRAGLGRPGVETGVLRCGAIRPITHGHVQEGTRYMRSVGQSWTFLDDVRRPQVIEWLDRWLHLLRSE